jgi:hypothetical protein
MQIEGPQTAHRGRSDALRDAALMAAARLDCAVRARAERVSRPAMIAVGLLTAAIAVVAYLRGADMRAGLAGGQPPELFNVLASVAKDDRAPDR